MTVTYSLSACLLLWGLDYILDWRSLETTLWTMPVLYVITTYILIEFCFDTVKNIHLCLMWKPKTPDNGRETSSGGLDSSWSMNRVINMNCKNTKSWRNSPGATELHRNKLDSSSASLAGRERSMCWAAAGPVAVCLFVMFKAVYIRCDTTCNCMKKKKINRFIYETDDDHDANYCNDEKIDKKCL